MTIQEVKTKLCYYDKRNPEGYIEWLATQGETADELQEGSKDRCSCDNCTTGRAALAGVILAYQRVIDCIHDYVWSESK